MNQDYQGQNCHRMGPEQSTFRNFVITSVVAAFPRENGTLTIVGQSAVPGICFARTIENIKAAPTLIEMLDRMAHHLSASREVLVNELREKLGEGTTGWTGE